MKLLLLLLVFSVSTGFSQIKQLDYINCGALSNNISCGIGEIFIIPQIQKKVVDKDKNYKYLTVFPNPCSDFLFIDSSQEIKSIDIYNLEGKFINKLNVLNNQIILDYLETGVYILKTDELSFEAIKIIKK